MRAKNILDDLLIYDIENILDVYEHGLIYKYNLNLTVYFNYDKSNLATYTTKCRQFWTTLSYLLYGTTRLAWVLMKINDVNAERIFQPVESGSTIVYPQMDLVKHIIDYIIS